MKSDDQAIYVVGAALLIVLAIGFFSGMASRDREVERLKAQVLEAEDRGRMRGRAEVAEWLLSPDACEPNTVKPRRLSAAEGI